MKAVEKLSTKNTESYKWGNNCTGWHLLNTDTLSAIEETMPPGTSEQAHFHRMAQQLFYILSGVATFETADNTIQVSANESFHVPPNTVHKISNGGVEPLRFIVISEPQSHGDRFNTD